MTRAGGRNQTRGGRVAIAALLGVLAWGAAAPPAAACSCVARYISPIEALREGAVVAEGVATATPGAGPQRRYRFAAAKSFNARLRPQVTVETAADSAACGVEPPLDQPTLLVLRPGDGPGRYRIDLCSQLIVEQSREQWRVLFDALPE